MAYFDERKNVSDAYRAQIEHDAQPRPPEAHKRRGGLIGWIVAALVVVALAIGIGSLDGDDAGNAPPAMAPAGNSVAPDAAPTGQTPPVTAPTE